jgi:glycosyltransferase involved in cell wall biosynthesis
MFAPEETSTAHYMTGIAEALAKVFPVSVLCVQPTYSRRGTMAPRRELLNGVHIIRCRSTAYDRGNLLLRLLNLITISASIWLASLIRLRRGDLALVVTNPPLLPLLIQITCLLKRARCIVRLDDIYADEMVAAGMLRKDSLKYRFMTLCSRWLYRKADRLIVLGRDAKGLVRQRASLHDRKVQVIPNWSDCAEVFPMPRAGNALLRDLGLSSRFVVLCAGNLGRLQAIEALAEAATLLRENDRIHFLFIGSGARKAWLEEQKSSRGLKNVTVLGPRPRQEQNLFLNACDIGTTALISGMRGVAIPSRLYNLLAAGKPVLVIGDPESEAALVVHEERVGWVASPDSPEEIARFVLSASQAPEMLSKMSCGARRLAESRFDRTQITAEYVTLAGELMRTR